MEVMEVMQVMQVMQVNQSVLTAEDASTIEPALKLDHESNSSAGFRGDVHEDL